MKNGQHNSSGNHDAELLEYIYGEMSNTARYDFETHLAVCDECASELASICDARLGVIEWRRTDFDHLASPHIVIPVQAPSAEIYRARAGSGVAVIFEWFALPMFARSGIVVAAAAFLVGIVYFAAVRRPETGYFAREGNTAEIQPVLPTGNISPVPGPDIPVALRPTSNASSTAQRSIRVGAAHKKTAQTAEAHISHRAGENVHDPRVAKQNPTVRNGPMDQAPRLNNFDEAEEMTLRLADLFEEVDAG